MHEWASYASETIELSGYENHELPNGDRYRLGQW